MSIGKYEHRQKCTKHFKNERLTVCVLYDMKLECSNVLWIFRQSKSAKISASCNNGCSQRTPSDDRSIRCIVGWQLEISACGKYLIKFL